MKTDVVKHNGQWQYDLGDKYMTASCHHQSKGACGGCYARAIEFLGAIADNEHSPAAQALVAALQKEASK